MDNFNFTNWFNSLKSNGNIHDKFDGALLDMIANNLDISHYTISHDFIPHNSGFIEKDENNKYFIEFHLSNSNNDISTGFTAYHLHESDNPSNDVKISLKIGGKFLPINAGIKIVNSCATYIKLKTRLTFEKDPFPVRLNYVSHILDMKIRAKIMKKIFVQDGIMYRQGFAIPI